MSRNVTLLPSTATDIAKAMDLLESRLHGLPVDAITKDPALVPVEMLDVLAWELSVDDWDESWPEAKKRSVLLSAHNVHRYKGTRFGVLAALAAMGYGQARIVEGWQMPRLGGVQSDTTGTPAPLGLGWVLGQAARALGFLSYGPGVARPLGRGWVLGWTDIHVTDYWVSVQNLISRRDADALSVRLGKVVPVRCRLRAILMDGVRPQLGVGSWMLGQDMPLGGAFKYEVYTNG